MKPKDLKGRKINMGGGESVTIKSARYAMITDSDLTVTTVFDITTKCGDSFYIRKELLLKHLEPETNEQ